MNPDDEKISDQNSEYLNNNNKKKIVSQESKFDKKSDDEEKIKDFHEVQECENLVQCLILIKKSVISQNFEAAYLYIDQIDGTDDDKPILQEFKQNLLNKNMAMSFRSVEKLQEIISRNNDGIFCILDGSVTDENNK